MAIRIDGAKVAPQGRQAWYALQHYVNRCALGSALVGPVKLHASQLNGHPHCLHLHGREAPAAGATAQRISLLDAWREGPGFTGRERAALAVADALTLVADDHQPDAGCTTARARSNEARLEASALAVISINGWNRISIAFRLPVGWRAPTVSGQVG